MTAIGNPCAALKSCIDVLANIPEPHYSPAVLPALIEARKALRGQPYPAASLETASCLWEAVLDMAAYDITCPAPAGEKAHVAMRLARRAKLIRDAREAMGTSALRMTVIGWTDRADAAWLEANAGDEGLYDAPFDWEFIPNWIVANVDWSNPNCPTVHTAPRIPVMAPGDNIRVASPLDELAADLRAWLVDDMGMTADICGGGSFQLRHEGPNGSYVLVSCFGGGGMPTHDSWHVGAYRGGDASGDESDAMLNLTSEHEGRVSVTLRMAIGAACGVLADFTAPPPLGTMTPTDMACELADALETVMTVLRDRDLYGDDYDHAYAKAKMVLNDIGVDLNSGR